MKRAAAIAVVALLVGCGGGGGKSGVESPLVRVSGGSPFARDCAGNQPGVLYTNAEVEPFVAVRPTDNSMLVGVWQQDRWSNGGAQGLMAAASTDRGNTWTSTILPVSTCGGGSASNGANFPRASDPWVSIAPDGTVYASSLSFAGEVLEEDSRSAILVTRSTDRGRSFGPPIAVIADGADAFDDKDSITADPTDASFVYVVWDRPTGNTNGPTYFARTTDGGHSWEPARSIYDPGDSSQTIGNVIAVLPGGVLLDLLTQIDAAGDGTRSSFLAVIRSQDHGATWSDPVVISELQAIGASDPQTGVPVRDAAGLGQIAIAPNGDAWVVWQDARFSGGERDGIALSRSTDGGLTWSAPAQVNGDTAVQAFLPSVAVHSEGGIGVSYYDSRNDTASSTAFLADLWLAESQDGASWHESQVAGPFDLDVAPQAEGGLFIGDYQGLTSTGTSFVPFFVQTNDTQSNRTDVFVLPPGGLPLAQSGSELRTATRDTSIANRPDFARRVSDRLTRLVMSRRRAGSPAVPN